MDRQRFVQPELLAEILGRVDTVERIGHDIGDIARRDAHPVEDRHGGDKEEQQRVQCAMDDELHHQPAPDMSHP